MPADAPTPAQALSIAAVERDTRLSKDTLRIWERRYGFPRPLRDSHGERLYPAEQVEQLRLLKRLLDTGHRPGQIVGKPATLLTELLQTTPPASPRAARGGPAASDEIAALVRTVQTHDAVGLRRQLAQAVLRQGLGHFINELAVPLCVAVGEAWARGELEVYQEHLCSETLSSVLRSAMAGVGDDGALSRPRVLLSTFPSEAHTLGLLMAEALLMLEGCMCINLGAQTPVHELALAAQAHQADIVALSFTAAVQPQAVLDGLADLRAALPAPTAVWVGSPLPALARRAVVGVEVFTQLSAIPTAVQAWRDQR